MIWGGSGGLSSGTADGKRGLAGKESLDFGGVEVDSEDVLDGLDDRFALLFAWADVWIEAGFDHGLVYGGSVLAGVGVELETGVAMVVGHDFEDGAAEGEEGL